MKSVPPSSRWKSFEGWDYNGMRGRLTIFIGSIKKQVFVEHAKKVLGKAMVISEPFSAGQHWACFELIAEDGDLVIARARLPKHPDTPEAVSAEDEEYTMNCEVATMKFLSANTETIPFPRLYDFAAPGSEWAAKAGCPYMLMEGFYGNTLQDVQFDMCQLPIHQQEYIISQWTSIQAELAVLQYSQIGSIYDVSENGNPSIGKLSSAASEGLLDRGPFKNTISYLSEVGKAKLRSIPQDQDSAESNSTRAWQHLLTKLGISIFLDIVENTQLFREASPMGPFHLNHMDLGTQNIIVDDKFKFLAVIDWEFAQTAPWEMNHYPMPFPLVWSAEKVNSILQDPDHLAYPNVSRQDTARRLYRDGFRNAEEKLHIAGNGLQRSIADTLDHPASKIYACFETLGVLSDQTEDLNREMVRLAFGYEGQDLERYLDRMISNLKALPASHPNCAVFDCTGTEYCSPQLE